jgi:site-specific recombinase XerD
MTDRRSVETPIDDTFPKYLADKGKGQDNDSGTYRRDASRELERFVSFLADRDDPVATFAELDADHLRSYARHLAGQGWTAGTVATYYAYVSAFCGLSLIHT